VSKNKRDYVDWLIDQGLGISYLCVMTLVLALFASGMMAVVLLMAWWEKVR
jgi:hypothetical protein